MITVVVPIYNMECYLKRCLDSLKHQTIKDIEVLLIDDGSTDKSAEICSEYVKKDDRFKYFYKINGGLSDARNVGTVLASGEYITYVDSDDYVHSTYLEYLLSLLKKYDADVACCGHTETSLDGVNFNLDEDRVLCMSGYEACERVLTDLAYTMTSAWANLYKTEIVKNYRFPYNRLHEDIPTTFKFYLTSRRVVYGYRELYAYYQRPNSIMHVISDRKVEDELWGISDRAIYLQKIGESELACKAWDFMLWYLKRNVLDQIGDLEITKKYGRLYIRNTKNLKKKLKIFLFTQFPQFGVIYLNKRKKI